MVEEVLMTHLICPVCHKHRGKLEMFSGESIRPALGPYIQKHEAKWTAKQSVCSSCLNQARSEMIEAMLLEERGAIGTAEREVLDAIKNQETISSFPFELSQDLTFGNRLSDKFAELGGSWKFIILFIGLLILWIILNTLFLRDKAFDPYPYILLNLFLSCLAAIQAPIIMMSQNRKEDKDRARSESDFKTNLKAELEIQHLNIKLDQLTTHQWNHLIEIQQLQLDTLKEIQLKNKM